MRLETLGNKQTVLTILALTGFATISSSLAALIWWIYRRINQATNLNAAKEDFRNVEQLYTTIEALRREIDELKSAQLARGVKTQDNDTSSSGKKSKTVRFKKTLSVLSSTDSEFQSIWSGTEDSSDEFFDLSDGEDLELDDSSANSLNEEALQIFDKVDSLLEGSTEDHKLAYNLLLEHEGEFSSNVEFLWRLAKACRMASQGTNDDNAKKEMTFKAVEFAKRALNADDSNAEAHKWYAIALGGLNDYLGVSEKIRNGYTFKEHLDLAMKISPRDPLLHHLLGRFCYEVSMLSWIERKVAASLFSNLPNGSVEEAIAHFQNAEKLQIRPWKENRYYLARCYIQLGKYSDAIHWVDEAINIPCKSDEDKATQKELLTLQTKYQGYRFR